MTQPATLLGAKEAHMLDVKNELLAANKQSADLLSALRELIEQVDSLEDYTLTRDLESWEAEACFDDALTRAKRVVIAADIARSKS